MNPTLEKGMKVLESDAERAEDQYEVDRVRQLLVASSEGKKHVHPQRLKNLVDGLEIEEGDAQYIQEASLVLEKMDDGTKATLVFSWSVAPDADSHETGVMDFRVVEGAVGADGFLVPDPDNEGQWLPHNMDATFAGFMEDVRLVADAAISGDVRWAQTVENCPRL